MCFGFMRPKVPEVKVSAASIVPETNAPEPEAPEYGGTNDKKRTGKEMLKINPTNNYNPMNF